MAKNQEMFSRRLNVALMTFVVLSTVGGALAASAASGVARRLENPGPIYWGAYMDGSETYSFHFGVKVGNAPWDASTWNRFETDAGKRVSIVHWGLGTPWDHDFDTWRTTFEMVRARGDLSLVDMTTGSVPLRDLARGARDAAILTWLREAAQYGHPFFLALDIEMNGVWEPYSPGVNGNTPADFVRMWRHLHDLAVQAGATNITWVWAPNVDPRRMFTPYWQLYPGSAYVDWTGLDGFNVNGRSTFSWLYRTSYQRLARIAPTKPVMITQVAAVDTRGRKASWITDALTRQLPTLPGIKAVVWFNWRIREKGRWMSYEIESSRAAQTAFARAIASSYYAPGGGYANLPLHTKIGPP